jgi:hypothetical protein
VRRPVALALGLCSAAVAIAAFAAPFASTLPDGLETTAAALGFAAHARASWTPLACLAPALAGVLGTVAAAAVAFSIAKSLSTADRDAHR